MAGDIRSATAGNTVSRYSFQRAAKVCEAGRGSYLATPHRCHGLLVPERCGARGRCEYGDAVSKFVARQGLAHPGLPVRRQPNRRAVEALDRDARMRLGIVPDTVPQVERATAAQVCASGAWSARAQRSAWPRRPPRDRWRRAITYPCLHRPRRSIPGHRIRAGRMRLSATSAQVHAEATSIATRSEDSSADSRPRLACAVCSPAKCRRPCGSAIVATMRVSCPGAK